MKHLKVGFFFFFLPFFLQSQEDFTIRISGAKQFILEKGCNPLRTPKTIHEVLLLDGQNSYSEPILLEGASVQWMRIIADSVEKEVYIDGTSNLELIFNKDSVQWELRENRNGLNSQIESINTQINTFISKQPLRPGLPLPSKSVKLFIDSIKGQSADHLHDYAKRYRDFRLAWLETSSRLKRYPSILSSAAMERKDDFNNPACLDLIDIVFENYLNEYARTVQGRSVINELKDNKNYASLWVSLKGDTLLKNDTLRQWVLLKDLKSLSFSTYYPPSILTPIVEGLMMSALTSEIKSEAQRMLDRWKFYEKGAKVPTFQFKDIGGKDLSFDEFKGKALYLIYYPELNTLVERELKQVQSISSRYEKDLNIVCLIGGESKKIKSVIDGSASKSFFVGIASTCTAIEHKRIFIEEIIAPAYFLIDAKQRFFKAPANSPETGVEAAFLSLIKGGDN